MRRMAKRDSPAEMLLPLKKRKQMVRTTLRSTQPALTKVNSLSKSSLCLSSMLHSFYIKRHTEVGFVN
jgi:hypothetical protein